MNMYVRPAPTAQAESASRKTGAGTDGAKRRDLEKGCGEGDGGKEGGGDDRKTSEEDDGCNDVGECESG